jgi:phage terminase large subunit
MAARPIRLPDPLVPIFTGAARYRGAYGGRGSGKSFNFAKMLAVRGYMAPLRILCARELQNSLRDSSLSQVIAAIQSEAWLDAAYDYGREYIRGKNGTEFIFKGVRHNPKEIKSTFGVNICWVEEAEAVSEESWRILIPTIREPGSEIWLTWNPEADDSPTNERFRLSRPSNSKIVQINYTDNPWFPDELDQERLDDWARDPDMYRHIWLGETITRTDAQVFNKRWRVAAFDDSLAAKADRLYFGADFGFAADPSTMVRCFVHANRLFIDYEAWGVGVEIDHMPAFYDQVPGARQWPIKADSARPETISYLARQGFRISGAEKWTGAVEDGIAHLKGYDEIVIHERCARTAEEFAKYSYKVDRITDDILPKIVDKYNHCIDALRYSHDGLIQRRGALGVWARLAS